MLFQQKKISACVGMLFGSVLINVQAQIAPPPDYDQKLKSVTVTATRSGTPLDEIPLNTTVLTKEALEVAPDQTIDQILKNVPGVILNDQPYYQKDPTSQSINVRGLGNARTLVLIDGLPANDAFYGTVQWNLVPMSSIDSVEFIRGGVSSLWGNYGMGGVINIKTKTPVNSQQEASASYGAFGTGNVAASKDLIASENLQLRFSADYFNTDGYQNIATISPGSPTNVKNGQGPASSHNSNVRMQGYFKATQDTNGFFRVGYHTMSDLSSGYAFATNLTQETDVAGGTTTRLDDKSKVDVNFFYENTNFNKQNGSTTTSRSNNIPANTPYINATYKDPYSTVGASALYTQEVTGLINQYVVGVDARNIAGSNLTNNLNNNGTSAAVNYAQGQQSFYGLMGQIKSNAESFPLETTLAARVDQWNSQTPTNYNAGSNGANPSYQNIPNQSKTQLSPTLGLLYKMNKNWDLRSAAYQAFHAPGMNNTLRSYGSSSGYSFANPNLTPETMTGYEVGTDYRWKGGFAQLTAFNNYIQNAVATYSLSKNSASDVALSKSLCGATGNPLAGTGNVGICNSTNISYYTNNQNLLSQGIEFQFHHDINSKWATDANYAFTSTKLTMSATSDPINKQVGGVPQNILGGGLTYYPVPQASFTATVRYVGSSWLNTSNTLPVASYAVVGLRANYELTKNATIYASAVNLFNRQYITFGTGGSSTSYTQGMPQAISVGGRIIFNHDANQSLVQTLSMALRASLGALGVIGQAQAQMDHSSGMAGAMKARSNDVCQGDGLQCANAATPFFDQNGKLLLAWTANGVVSVAQSTDLGKTFTPTTKIAEHGKSLDAGSDARPQIVSDKAGNVFLAYSFFKDAHWNAQINTARSTDGGNTFTAPTSLVNDGSSQRFPSVLIKPDGNIFISWIDKRLVAAAKQSGEKRLGGSIAYSFSQDGGKSFEAERFANESSCECCRIGAALDPQGQPVIVYRAIFAGGIRDQASQVISGKSAGPVRRVADDDWKTDACPHHGPSIAVSSSGKFHVAWYTQGSKRSGVFYANSINQGASYSKPSRIGMDGSNVARPYLFASGQQVWLVWKEFDGKKSSVYIQDSVDDGNTWSSSRVLASTEGYSDHPLLLSHGDAVFLSWLTRADGYQLINVGHKK